MPSQFTVDDALVVRAAVNAAFHYHFTLELAEQYRSLTDAAPKGHPLTNSLAGALDILDTYLLNESEEDESVSGEQQLQPTDGESGDSEGASGASASTPGSGN